MDLFSMHADTVLRDLLARQQQGPAAQMVRGTKAFDPLRQGKGFTLAQSGFSLKKHGGAALNSAKFRRIPKNVREEAEDMGRNHPRIQRAGVPRDEDAAEVVVVEGDVAGVGGDRQPPTGGAGPAAGAEESQESKEKVREREGKESKDDGTRGPLAAALREFPKVHGTEYHGYVYEDEQGNLFDLGDRKNEAIKALGLRNANAFKKAAGGVGKLPRHTPVRLSTGGSIAAVHPRVLQQMRRAGKLTKYSRPAPTGDTPAAKAELAAMRDEPARKRLKAVAGDLLSRLEALSPAERRKVLSAVSPSPKKLLGDIQNAL